MDSTTPCQTTTAQSSLAAAQLMPARSAIRSRRHRPGMTLVEIMIVLTIMAAMMGMAAYHAIGMKRAADIREAQAESAQLSQMVDSFQVLVGRAPHDLEELAQDVSGVRIAQRVPEDPWGADYVMAYREGTQTYYVYSAGPDGITGTEDDCLPASEL